MEVAPGVYALSAQGPGEDGGSPANVYWVAGQKAGAFIEAGHGGEKRVHATLEAWRRIAGNLPALWVLLTDWYEEHCGGAASLRAATGARVAAGRADAERIDRQAGGRVVDLSLDGGEEFDLGGRRLRAIATPGHTRGSVTYFLEEERVLFPGDHIPGTSSVAIDPDDGGDVEVYMASLRGLLPLLARLILPGHGPPLADPRAAIEDLLARRARRHEQVLRLLEEGVGEVDAIAARLYPDVAEGLRHAARQQVLAHLIVLARDGRAAMKVPGEVYRLA